MATAVLFIGWDRAYPGMEEKAYGYAMGEGMEYLRKLEGKAFERMEVVGLTPHGGDLNGFILLLGERAKLDELRRADEFEAFVMKLGQSFNRIGVIPGVNWEGIQAVMARRAQMAKP
jgi:hypothetical protein